MTPQASRQRPVARERRTESRAHAAASSERTALLTKYQRIGRALLELRKKRGVVETEDLWQRFRALRIHAAAATVTSRAAAAAALDDLHEQIERSRGVEITQGCLENPLAAGCR